MYMVIADYQPYHSQMARPNVLTNINTSAAMGKPVRTKSAFRNSPMVGSPPCAFPDPQLTPTAIELAFGNDDICIMQAVVSTPRILFATRTANLTCLLPADPLRRTS